MGSLPWGKWGEGGMARLLCQQLVTTVEEQGWEWSESCRKPSQEAGWGLGGRAVGRSSGPGTGGTGQSEVGRGQRPVAYMGRQRESGPPELGCLEGSQPNKQVGGGGCGEGAEQG